MDIGMKIKKDIKKLRVIKEKECECPMCKKTDMEIGTAYFCKKTGAYFGTSTLRNFYF